MGELLHGPYKWAIGVLGFLVVVWLLMRQRGSAGGSSGSSGAVVVQQAQPDPQIAALNAQLASQQAQGSQQVAAYQTAAQAQTAQVIAQAQAALGIATAGYDAAKFQAEQDAAIARYNADAAVAIQGGINAADVAKTISTNSTAVQVYGIQAGVANNAINTAGAIDLASIQAEHETDLATLRAQTKAAKAYYDAALPLGLAQTQAERDRFNTLATIYKGNYLLHSDSQGANMLAGFLGLVNPSSAATGNITAASVGISKNQAKASIFQSIFGAISSAGVSAGNGIVTVAG